MDSDDVHKNVGAVLLKTAFQVAPMLIPGVNTYYGGVTAGLAMMQFMPEFIKAINGIFGGKNEVGKGGIIDDLNAISGVIGRFDSSVSDYAQNN